MDADFLGEVISAAHAFQRASRREILSADDVRKALEICSFPAPKLSTPGFAGTNLHRVELKKQCDPLNLTLPLKFPPKFAVQSQKWVLSVCVPRAKKRKAQISGDSFGAFAAVAAMPPHQREYVRLAALNICSSWATNNFQVQRESLRRLGLASPKIRGALMSLVSQNHPPAHLLKKLASVGPRDNWKIPLMDETLKTGKTAAELLRCVRGTELENHVRSIVSARIENCSDWGVALELIKVFGAPAGLQLRGGCSSFDEVAKARKVHLLSNSR